MTYELDSQTDPLEFCIVVVLLFGIAYYANKYFGKKKGANIVPTLVSSTTPSNNCNMPPSKPKPSKCRLHKMYDEHCTQCVNYASVMWPEQPLPYELDNFDEQEINEFLVPDEFERADPKYMEDFDPEKDGDKGVCDNRSFGEAPPGFGLCECNDAADSRPTIKDYRRSCDDRDNNQKYYTSCKEKWLIDEYDDPVDKINVFVDKSYKDLAGKKIGDVFDDLTKTKEHPRKCVYKPDAVDPITHDAVYFAEDNKYNKFAKPDMWMYENENTMNGGHMGNGVYGHDLMDNTFPIVQPL